MSNLHKIHSYIYRNRNVRNNSIITLKSNIMEDSYDHIDSSLIYVTESIPGVDCPDSFHEEFLEGCRCNSKSQCIDPSHCSCLKGTKPLYDENSRITWPLPLYPMFECNSKCSCKGECKNSVIMKGPIKNLYVQKISNDKGLGVFCKNKISKGSFICTYSGEIIGIDEGLKRTKEQQEKRKSNYILFVKEYFATESVSTVIDPTIIGNIGRYLNHSCDPNLVMIPVRVQNMVPHIALFACTDIPSGTELTYDYGNTSTDRNIVQANINNALLTLDERTKLVKCLCGSKSCCKKYLPYHR